MSSSHLNKQHNTPKWHATTGTGCTINRPPNFVVCNIYTAYKITKCDTQELEKMLFATVSHLLQVVKVIWHKAASQSPYTLQWPATFPLKIAFSHGGPAPTCSTLFPGHTPLSIKNNLSIGLVVFAGLMIIADQQTTLFRLQLYAASPYVVLRCWCGLIIITVVAAEAVTTTLISN